jgi:type VI secretion system protein ImpM
VSPVIRAAPLEIGLFGKIPAERDFVRVNSGGLQQAGLDGWFQEGMEQVRRDRTSLPGEPTRFIFPAAGSRPFVGAFAPGQDALGRVFPVVVSAVCKPERGDFSLLPLRLAPFLDACAGLALGAQGLTALQLVNAVAALASSVPLAEPELGLDAVLARSSLSELCPAGVSSLQAAAYALTTALAACVQKREGSSSRVLTLDTQASSDGVRTFWLELLARNLGMQWPAVFWTSHRLLMALGPAPSAMLAYLADPDHKSTRRWPMHTLHAAAHARAVERLAPAQARMLTSGDPSLVQVLSTFSPLGANGT